jgi:hypothetical protein
MVVVFMRFPLLFRHVRVECGMGREYAQPALSVPWVK